VLTAAASADPFLAEILPAIPSLRRAAARFGDAADDLVQATLLRALRRRETYRSGFPAAWLRRILHNLAADANRQRRRDERLAAKLVREQIVAAGERPPELARVPPDVVRAAVAQLSERDRRVVELVDFDGLRYHEAADRLGVPIGTVMSRLHRARRCLRSLLDTE
jgi:RNA polymerase sigma factor (sigma-70 family)